MRNMAVYSDPLIVAEVNNTLASRGIPDLQTAQKTYGLVADGILGPKSYRSICKRSEPEVLGASFAKYFEEDITLQHRDVRRLPVTLIVIHWTAGGGFQGIIDWFKDRNNGQVSAHYVVGVEGDVCRQVPERSVAWHAGPAVLGNYGNQINDCSIGIEMCGPPSMVGLKEWTPHILYATVNLCKDIKTRFPNIRLTDHSTILPAQKTDVKKGTGIDVFPWDWFVKECGIPEAQPTDVV